MKYHVVAIRDIQTDAFGLPIHVSHIAQAIRLFADRCQGKSNDETMANHPDHFELYQLAIWDDNTGKYEENRVQLAVGSNYQRAQK